MRLQPAVDDHRGERLFEEQPLARHCVGQILVRPHPDQIGGGERARIGEVGDRLRDLGDRPVIGLGGRGSLGAPAAEAGADQLFHHVRIGVADHDDGGALGPVPAPVEGAQALRGGAVQRLLGADRVAPRVKEAGIDEALRQFEDALVDLGPQPFLGEHDRPLGVERAGVDSRPRHHLGEHGKAGVERLARGVRQVQHIDGVGRVGAGIGVAAEARAQLLPDLARAAVRIGLGAAKQHMFEEMRPAALIVRLMQRADIDADADRDLPRRQRVPAHRILKPVGQSPEPPRRIARDVRPPVQPVSVAALGQGRRRGEEEEGEEKRTEERHGGLLGRRAANVEFSSSEAPA